MVQYFQFILAFLRTDLVPSYWVYSILVIVFILHFTIQVVNKNCGLFPFSIFICFPNGLCSRVVYALGGTVFVFLHAPRTIRVTNNMSIIIQCFFNLTFLKLFLAYIATFIVIFNFTFTIIMIYQRISNHMNGNMNNFIKYLTVFEKTLTIYLIN